MPKDLSAAIWTRVVGDAFLKSSRDGLVRENVASTSRGEMPFKNQREFELQYFGAYYIDNTETTWKSGYSLIPDRGRNGEFHGFKTHFLNGQRAVSAMKLANKPFASPKTLESTVMTPDGRRKLLFGAPVGVPERRHDCVQDPATQEWYCVYTDYDYKLYQKELGENQEAVREAEADVRRRTNNHKKAKQEYQDARRSKEELAEQKFAQDLDPTVGMSEEDKIRMRQANSQFVLLSALKEISETGVYHTYKEATYELSGEVEDEGSYEFWSGELSDTAPKNLMLYAGAPGAFMGAATIPAGVEKFFCATSAELGALVPSLKFYIDGEHVEFPDHASAKSIKDLASSRNDPSKILKGRGTLGTDVGIKSFEWQFNNIHEGDRILKAQMQLHFGSVRELRNQKWLDFVFTGKNRARDPLPSKNNQFGTDIDFDTFFKGFNSDGKQTQTSWRRAYITALEKMADEGLSREDAFGISYKKEDFPIKDLTAVVGWEVPKGSGVKKLFNSGFLEALKRCKKTIKLNLIKTNVDFGQQGQVTLNLEYIGSLDAFFADADASNIFASTAVAQSAETMEIVVPSTYQAVDGGLALSGKGQDALETWENVPPSKPSARDISNYEKIYGERASEIDELIRRRLVGSESRDYTSKIRNAKSFNQKWEIRQKYFFATSSTLKGSCWPKGNIALAETDSTTITGQGLVPAIRISKQEVKDEIRRLKIKIKVLRLKKGMLPHPTMRKTMGELGAIRDDAEIQRYNMYLRTAVECLRQVDVILSAEINSAYLQTILAGSKMYYVEVERSVISGTPLQNTPGKNFRVMVNNASGGRQPVRGGDTQSHKAAEAAQKVKANVARESLSQKIKNEVKLRKAFHIDPAPTTTADGRPTGGTAVRVYYVKLGDLLDIACSDNNKNDITMVLGSYMPAKLNFRGFRLDEVASLYDLPISLDYFSQWWVDHMGVPGITKMSMRAFLNKLFKDLIAPLINQIWNRAQASTRVYFDFSSMVSPKSLRTPVGQLEQKLFPMGTPQAAKHVGVYATKFVVTEPQLRQVTHQSSVAYGLPSKNIFRSYFIQAVFHGNEEDLIGNRTEDEKRGVMHLVLGSPASVVKSFNFSEKQLPQIRAMAIESGLPLEGLVLPQDCSITMFGNTFFKNGQMIYIDADFGLGRAAQQLGVGGYYTIHKVSNSIAPGKFETVLECIRKFGSYTG